MLLKGDGQRAREIFGRRLRELRLAHGADIGRPKLSLRQFAVMIGISPERLSFYERGAVEPPFAVLIELQRITRCSLDRLIAGTANTENNKVSVQGVRPHETIRLGHRMRWVRETTADTQAVAAELLGVSEADYARWEAGGIRPDLEQAAEFASRYRCRLDFLLTGDLDSLDPELRAVLVTRHPLLAAKIRKPTVRRRGRKRTDSGNSDEGAVAASA